MEGAVINAKRTTISIEEKVDSEPANKEFEERRVIEGDCFTIYLANGLNNDNSSRSNILRTIRYYERIGVFD